MVKPILHLVAHVHVMSYPFWTAANLTDGRGAVTVQKVRLEGAHKYHPHHVFNPSLSSYHFLLLSQPFKDPSTIVVQLLLCVAAGQSALIGVRGVHLAGGEHEDILLLLGESELPAGRPRGLQLGLGHLELGAEDAGRLLLAGDPVQRHLRAHVIIQRAVAVVLHHLLPTNQR